MTIGDKGKYVLLKTKSLINRIRQQHNETVRGIYEHVADIVKWNTFRDWAYRGWSRMPLEVFKRLKNKYKLKESPKTVTEKQWYTLTRKRAAEIMHECHPHKEWLSEAAKKGGEAVKEKYGVKYLTNLSARAIHSSSSYRYEDDDGNKYRSRLELSIAKLLRTHNFKFIYEPEIEGYVPDFKFNNTLIEVCGYFRDKDYLTRLTVKLIDLVNKGWQIILICQPRKKAVLTQAVKGISIHAIMTQDEFRRFLTTGKR